MGSHHQHRGKYPDELRERAVRMVLDPEDEYGSQWEAICSVAEKLGSNAEPVRVWVWRAETDRGSRTGSRSDQLSELKRLKRENAELRRANDILKAAAHFFGMEFDRRPKRQSRSSTSTRTEPAAGYGGVSSRSVTVTDRPRNLLRGSVVRRPWFCHLGKYKEESRHDYRY